MSIQIIADSREYNSGLVKLLQANPALSVSVGQLEIGDYQISPEFVVERKEAMDFINSIRDGRLFSQVKFTKANFERAVLIVEGGLYDERKYPHGFTSASLQGALSDLVVLEGVSVIPSKDVKDSAGLIATMARHAQEGLGYEIPLRVAKPKDIRVLQQYIIEGLPGIGPKRAQDILAHFGSVLATITASKEDWMRVPGLGKATAEKVTEIIRARFDGGRGSAVTNPPA